MKIKLKIELEEGETAASLARDCRSDDAFRCPCNKISACPWGMKDERACKTVTAAAWKKVLKEGLEIREDA